MSLDQTLYNLNSSLEKLTTNVSSLLLTIQVMAAVFTLICTVLALGFLVLACQAKCKREEVKENEELRASQTDLTRLMIANSSADAQNKRRP
uniref:Uncharacterized protein n=1 Tax=Plectus sambesii TaxID=2011161 RepID=A0A914XII7_9BILA